jgi:hypothetical protein
MTYQLTNDQAESILQHSDPMEGLLDRVEQALRDANQFQLADRFARLVSDIGLEQEPTFESDPSRRPPPPGPATAALWAAYTPVTIERVKAVFTDIKSCSGLGESLRNEFSELVSTVFPPPSAYQPRPLKAPQP